MFEQTQRRGAFSVWTGVEQESRLLKTYLIRSVVVKFISTPSLSLVPKKARTLYFPAITKNLKFGVLKSFGWDAMMECVPTLGVKEKKSTPALPKAAYGAL
jgi:hypothetical protein